MSNDLKYEAGICQLLIKSNALKNLKQKSNVVKEFIAKSA